MADPGIVALLFTDLVGSTAMYDRLGDERAEELRRSHFATLRTAIESHGGTEVKNLGDGLMVTFPSAVAAVEAAVEIQRAVAPGAAPAAGGVAVRIGLHAGEPLLEDGDYFGVSVNIAKRLCDRADAGQILVSDLIRALVSPRARSALHPIGELTLKGIEEPVDTYAVEWELPEPPRTGLTTLPAGLTATGPLVGREVELDALVHTWKRTVSGDRRRVLISGEPGIGKTRLVAALAARASEDDPMILVGRCDGELAAPFAPFRDAFRDASLRGEETARRMSADPRLEWLVAPAATARGMRDAERGELFDAVTAVLHEGVAIRPLLLVLEDVHWADEASLLLLRHLLQAAPPSSLVVLTYRDTEISRGHPLSSMLADLRRSDDVERIALRGLSAAAVEVLLADGGPPSPGLASLATRIAGETEGNPFFVHEIVRHLAEQGRLHRGESGWEVVGETAAIEVPEGVRDVVGQRLGRLTPSCNDVLTAASVIGRTFSAAAVADVGGIALETTLDAIDEAVRAHIVEDADRVGSFSFTHALIREVLYLELTTIQRLRLHHRIGELLERAGKTSEAARHLLEAAPVGDRRRAVEVALRAVGDATHRLAAYEDAANLCNRALALVEDEDEDRDLECDLRIALGDAMVSANDVKGVDHLRRALRIARDLDDADRMATAVTYAVRYGPGTALMAEFVEAARDVIGLAPGVAPGVRARLRAVLRLARAAPSAHEDHMTVEVLAEAIGTGDLEAIAYAALARADELLVRGDARGAVEVLESVQERVIDAMPEAVLPFGARYLRAAIRIADGELVDVWLVRMDAASARYGGLQWAVNLPRAVVAFLKGHLDDALALALHVFGDGAGEEQAGAVLAAVARERGEGAGILAMLEERDADSDEAAWRVALALFLVDAGRTDEAAGHVTGILDAIAGEVGLPVALAMLAEVAHATEDLDLASAVAAELETHAGLTVSAGPFLCLGAADRYLGLCLATAGDIDAALDLLAQGERVNDRLGATLFATHTRIDRAELLLRRRADGDRDAALVLLDTAARDAERRGLVRALQRVEVLRERNP